MPQQLPPPKASVQVTRLEMSHAVLDALQAVGDSRDYYRINHLPYDQIFELSEVIAKWLEAHGVGPEK